MPPALRYIRLSLFCIILSFCAAYANCQIQLTIKDFAIFGGDNTASTSDPAI